MMSCLVKTASCLLMLSHVFASDLPTSNHLQEQATSCPAAGYYYREARPSELGGCYLCFCQNSTAICFERDRSTCGAQIRQIADLSPPGNRARRSPVSLSDIFFRDATRDFFQKQLPEQCKPHESSFSDGCPPADWCVGCTVCDCDSNGRWDCHILSFCNGEETKRKVKKVPLPKDMPTRRVYHNNAPPKNQGTPKPKRNVKKSIPNSPKPRWKKQSTRKSNNNKNPVKKNINNGKTPTNKSNNNKKPNKPKPNQARANHAKRKAKEKSTPKPKQTPKKIHRKRYMVRKKPKSTTKATPTKQDLRRNTVTPTTSPETNLNVEELKKQMNTETGLEETELGRKIVRKMMSTVQRMLSKQMEKLQNYTRVQRSIIQKESCERNKKKKKPNQLNISRLSKRKWKNTPPYKMRYKREAPDLDLSVIELKDVKLLDDHVTDLSVLSIMKNTTDYGNEELEKTTFSNDIFMETETSSTVTEELPTTNSLPNTNTVDKYYKYILDRTSRAAEPTDYITKTFPPEKSTTPVTNTDINTTVKTTEEAYPSSTNKHQLQDHKYKKMKLIKHLKDNTIQINEVVKFNKVNEELNEFNNDSSFIKQLMKKKLSKNLRRKYDDTKQQYLIKFKTDNFNVSSKYFGTTVTPTNGGNNTSLQILLHNLINELNKNTTAPTKKRAKFSIFKYLRPIFRNLFSRKKGNTLKGHKTNERMTLEILCENIGACFLNSHNRISLRNRIHDLNMETENIFKLIKIIKGLLYLIELPHMKGNTTKQDEIYKLDAILKGVYEANTNLTKTQTTQIAYIKDNIHHFIESVGKFATILNEILEVLYKNNKQYSCQRNLRLSNKKRKLNALNKIKNLLVKYNLVQNTFMKKMYKLLTVKNNMTTVNPKVSDRNLDSTQVFDKFSKNFLQNLRSLKKLAQKLSSSISTRKKRQTMKEEAAIDYYILVLLSHLLKQNQPAESEPVTDGIDVLLEAIQTAPDIKPIIKKVFQNPTTPMPTRTPYKPMLSYFKEAKHSDVNTILKAEDETDSEDEAAKATSSKKFHAKKMKEKEVKSVEKVGSGEKTDFDKSESAIDETRRNEAGVETTTEEPVIDKVEENEYASYRDLLKSDYMPKSRHINNKIKLDWVEENYDKEIKEFKAEQSFEKTTTKQPETTKSVDNISSITVEVEDEKKKALKVADDLMRKKQLAFLNSLDYGTERSDFLDPDIKEEEKFSDFPAYFVK